MVSITILSCNLFLFPKILVKADKRRERVKKEQTGIKPFEI